MIRKFSCLWMVMSVSALAGPGFFTPQAQHLPPAVVNLRHSVFRAILQGERPAARVEASDLEAFRDALAARDLARLARWRIQGSGGSRWYAALLNEQLATHPASSPFFIKDCVNGTGFLFGDKRTIVLPAHLFYDSGIGPEELFTATNVFDLKKSLKGWIPNLILLDESGNKIVDLQKGMGPSFSRFRFFGSPAYRRVLGRPYDKINETAAHVLFDFVIVEFSSDLPGTPMVASEGIASGGAAFAVGYPDLSRLRMQNHGAPDSDGESLRFMSGVFTKSPPQDYADFLYRDIPGTAARNTFLSNITFTDVDLVRGASGGPIVDSNGKLLGTLGRARHRLATPEEDFSVTASFGPCAWLIAQDWR